MHCRLQGSDADPGSATGIHQDPAMLKYYDMTMNRARFFRWTPRTARITFIYVVVVPMFFGVLGYKYDVRTPRGVLLQDTDLFPIELFRRWRLDYRGEKC